jgi:hypothetical protein
MKGVPMLRPAFRTRRLQGFSLFEMAIVIIIIGFIVGGVVVGQSLIRASELRAVMTEVGAMTKAIKLFQDKYQALPGDMSNAQTMWDVDPNGCPNGTAGSTTKTSKTCNGNGDGRISILNADIGAAPTEYTETYRAWQQLSDAGMIEGRYTGVTGSGGAYDAVISQNVPASRLSGGGYTLRFIISAAGSASYYPGSYGHTLTFGTSNSGTATVGTILRPSEALEVDQKFDDGKPAYGTIMTFRTGGTIASTCANNAAAASAAYDTSNAYPNCAMIFILGF